MIKSIRKGLTLLELVIAMALSSIVIGGATVLFLSLNSLSDAEIKNFSESSDTKNLVLRVDEILSSSDNKTITVNTAESFPSPLFTIEEISGEQYSYSFVEKTLTKKNISTEAVDTIYTVKYDTEITQNFDSSTNIYEFIFKFGKDYSKSMSLVKRIG